MSFFAPQNPGIGGIDELTAAEELFLTSLAGLTYSDGDILYYDGNTGYLTNLQAGTSGQVLTISAGIPSWIDSTLQVITDNGNTTTNSITVNGLNSNSAININNAANLNMSATSNSDGQITGIGRATFVNNGYFGTISGAFITFNNSIGSLFAKNVRMDDNLYFAFGTGRDYSLGHHSATDTFQIVDGSTLNSNVRLQLNSLGQFAFGAYGSGSNTGTPTYSLQTDSSGNVIEGPKLVTGTYTPTLTGVTNVASSTAYTCQYMQVGNMVTVSGQIFVNPTSNNAETTIGISLPIASNFGNSYELGGTAHKQANTDAGHGAGIYADATNNRAEMDYFETHGGGDTLSFTFTYQII